MGTIRVGVFIYHELIYSASLFNKLNGLCFASSFNVLKQLGFIDHFMINKRLLASDYSYIILHSLAVYLPLFCIPLLFICHYFAFPCCLFTIILHSLAVYLSIILHSLAVYLPLFCITLPH